MPPSAPRRAGIRRLTLSKFRSYETLDASFSGKPVVLYGANGAGKTNLLEALSLIGSGRGMRHAKLADVTRQGCAGPWSVAVTLADDSGEETRLGITGGGDKRSVRIDGAAGSGPVALLDHLRFLWLTPAQDRLFMEGASERRRFLDRMTLAHDAAHARAAATYDLSMRQRQKLLEQPRPDATLLTVLEQQMAKAGIAMAASRLVMAAQLAQGAQALAGGAFPTADIALEGEIETRLSVDKAGEVEEWFAATLKTHRRRDSEVGRALDGPHRSDLIVTHREKSQAARLCSTGEQKALLISLILANAKALARDASGVPLILLLDEVAAHLDQHRRGALFDILETIGFQSFLTGTDAGLFSDFGARAEHFEVVDGRLEKAPAKPL